MFRTIISGVLVASLTWLIQKNIFEPTLEYKKKLGEINNIIKYYSPHFYNDLLKQKKVEEISNKIRKISCDLEEKYRNIPFKKQLINLKFKSIKSEEDISYVSSSLIYLSNIVGKSVKLTKETHTEIHINIIYHISNIKYRLGFYMTEKELKRYKIERQEFESVGIQ